MDGTEVRKEGYSISFNTLVTVALKIEGDKFWFTANKPVFLVFQTPLKKESESHL